MAKIGEEARKRAKKAMPKAKKPVVKIIKKMPGLSY